MFAAGISLAFPLIVGKLLDAALEHRDPARLNAIALGLLALFGIQAILNYIQAYYLAATGERTVSGLRKELFTKLLTMPPGFFAERRTGELTSRLTADITILQGVVGHQIAEFTRQIIALVGGVIILTVLQPQLTLTALGIVPFVIATAFFFGRKVKRATTVVQEKVGEATAMAEEAFSQIRIVQGFAQESWEKSQYDSRIDTVIDSSLLRARIRAAFFGILTFGVFGAVTAVFWQGGRLVLDGSIAASDLITFFLITVTIAASIGALASFYSGVQEAMGAAERVFELLDDHSDIIDPAVPLQLPQDVSGEVVFDEVVFRYRKDSEPGTTLDRISFRIAPGEVVALIGPSGAGKTTIASLLPRFWDVDAGAIRLDGIDIRALRLTELRQAIGIVPQEPALFSGSIRDNIAYSNPSASIEAVRHAAMVANAHDFIAALPEGYDTRVGQRGVKLSGGQRQRIAIARAVLKNPAVLILDEATSALDNESERLVESAMERLLVGRTTLIIAHRLSTVQRADRLIVLDHGRIVETGTHSELLRAGGVYARLFQMQWRGNGEVEQALFDRG